MLNFKESKEIKGDASFRKFYRNKNNHSIVVYAKKEKVQNLLIYDAINKILNKNKILAPKLLNQNYKNNYIEVEDFGDNTLGIEDTIGGGDNDFDDLILHLSIDNVI